MTSVVTSLEAVLNNTTRYWNLDIQDSMIQEASILRRMTHYISSFFSSDHQMRLKETLLNLIDKFHPTNEEEKKLVEKIHRVITSCKDAWCYQVASKVDEKSSIRILADSHPDAHNLMKPIMQGGRFVNFEGEGIWWQFIETLRLLFPGALSKATNLATIQDLEYIDPKQFSSIKAREEDIKFIWLGHSTILLQGKGFNLLFDPSYGFIKPCFTRHVAAPIELKHLPLVDILFISHSHEDHCEEAVVDKLKDHQPIVVSPKLFNTFFSSKGYEHVHDVTWWERREFTRDGQQITLTSIPAKHGAQRGISDLNKHLWHGVVIEIDGTKIYFAGDTAYDANIISDIKKTFGKVDLAFIPIAPENEEGVHLNCDQSLQFFEELGASKMFPIHFGVYRQGPDTLERPYELLLSMLKDKYQHLKDKIILPKLGKGYSAADF